MINREIPFRPRLEGEFRVRFYNAASEITEKTPTLTIARIAEREIEWVEKDCQYNIEQRKKYRAVWFLFRDLIRASWKACYRNGVIYMSLPTLNGTDMHDTTSPEVKALLRSWMSESRHERLVGYTDFINRMENPGTNKQSIAALIADGDELEKRIKRVHTGEIAIEAAVQPYLQLVRENDRDVFTGLKTSEIWRYFRLTWSTPVETTPGRTMQYLIRDAAHPMHAVMGIASLENCAVQITCRDDYIGWNQKAFIERIVTVDNDRAKEEFKQLLVYLEDGIDGIDYSELCTAMVVKNPTDTDIQLLLDEASNAEQNRQQLLRNEVEGDVDDIEKSELGSIFIHDTNTLIEIKSTLSFSKKSTFPTVYSERAVKQLTEISRLLDEGYRACYILVSLNPSVKEITINSEIEDYYKEFMKCIEKGMTYCAFSIRLHEQTPELYAKIKITI